MPFAGRIFGARAAASPDIAEMALRTSYPVALGMIMVVLSFATTLGYSHFLLQPIDERALSIVEHEIPSLQHLANVRVALARLGKDVRDFVVAEGPSRNPIGRGIDAKRARIKSEFRLYRALPTSSGEARWIPVFEQHLAQLEGAAERVILAAGSGTARQSLEELFEPALERTDSAAGMLQRLNEAEALSSANRILKTRHEATAIATLLGAASLGIAFVAMLLVMRVLRARARITRKYLRLLGDRNAELEAFAGRVAHDLKDPLGAVALQLVVARRRQQLKPEQAPHFDAIDRQLERMNQMIDALLEFARAGAASAPEGRADLAEVLSTVVASVRPRLDAIQAELTVAPVPSLEVCCAPGALSSVLSNLLGNAAKFLVEGSELPRRIAVRVNEKGNLAHVEIEDNGPGIPVGAEERIFEPFQRLRETRQPGFGIGLATVKKIVETYHGRLGVRSRSRKGSVFWFELPKAALRRDEHGEHGEQVGRDRRDARLS